VAGRGVGKLLVGEWDWADAAAQKGGLKRARIVRKQIPPECKRLRAGRKPDLAGRGWIRVARERLQVERCRPPLARE
jgi:hypothetical protein